MVTDHRAGQNHPATPPSGAAMGLILFAGIMMIMVGVFQAIQGVVALFNDTFYVVGQKWVFSFNVTTWGWIHLLAGVVLVVAGYFLFQGAVWARVVGVSVTIISAVLSFMWLPYYPIWSILIIALDVFIIWALTVHGRDVAQ
jgi:hypothetical protein